MKSEMRSAQLEEQLKGAHAMLVLQQLHVAKIEVERAEKAATTQTRNPLFPGGCGQELTGPEFMECVQAAQQAREDKENEKQRRKDARGLKKERDTACEEEWKRRSNAHKEAREDWIKWAAQMGYDMKKKKALLILWKGSLILFLLKLQ
jgi:hypothetical protein